MRLKLTFICLISLFLLAAGCARPPSLARQLDSIVKPYYFSVASWELKTLGDIFRFWGWGDDAKQTASVTEYFALVQRINDLEAEIAGAGDKATSLEDELDRLREQRAALAPGIEGLIAEQVKGVLAEEGIFHPVDSYFKLKVNFPPIDFEFVDMPLLLVVSPRDRIESLREITLLPSLSLEEIERVEARVDKLGYSSLVTEIGGLGATYPTMVPDTYGPEYAIGSVIEEWLHQYLVFKPLGFLYLLDVTGVARNYDIATMNETVASIVGGEIKERVLAEYYPDSFFTEPTPEGNGGFDFNGEMREIRRTVDKYLANGEIAQAEAFMEAKRQYLAANGYRIRKLNQAYFAYHGTYADSPTSISPVGAELQSLRQQSASLKAFLETAASLTGRKALAESIE